MVQGSDSVEDTAFVLDLPTRGTHPVGVTGAMRGLQAALFDGYCTLGTSRLSDKSLLSCAAVESARSAAEGFDIQASKGKLVERTRWYGSAR